MSWETMPSAIFGEMSVSSLPLSQRPMMENMLVPFFNSILQDGSPGSSLGWGLSGIRPLVPLGNDFPETKEVDSLYFCDLVELSGPSRVLVSASSAFFETFLESVFLRQSSIQWRNSCCFQAGFGYGSSVRCVRPEVVDCSYWLSDFLLDVLLLPGLEDPFLWYLGFTPWPISRIWNTSESLTTCFMNPLKSLRSW